MKTTHKLFFSILLSTSCTQLVPRHTISEKQISKVRENNFGKNEALAELGAPIQKIETKDKEILVYALNNEDCVEGLWKTPSIVFNIYPPGGHGLYYWYKKNQCDKSQSSASFIFDKNELKAAIPGFSEQNFFQKPDGNLGIATKCQGGTASCLQLAAKICGRSGYEILEKKVVGSNSSTDSSSITVGNATGTANSTYNSYTRSIATTGQASGYSNTFTSVETSTAVVEEMLFSCSK